MNAQKDIQPVPEKFIERGIEKYGGKVDKSLSALLKRSDCDFIPYRFNDGRYLLVHPISKFGFLYPDVETVYDKLVLD